MDESALIHQILPNREDFINRPAKIADFITTNKHWSLSNLTNILPSPIIEKILLIPLFLLILLKIRLFGNIQMMVSSL